MSRKMRTMAMNIHGYSMQKVKKSLKTLSEKRENTMYYFLKKTMGKKIVVCQTFYLTYYFSATKGKSIIIIHEWKFSAAQRQMNL